MEREPNAVKRNQDVPAYPLRDLERAQYDTTSGGDFRSNTNDVNSELTSPSNEIPTSKNRPVPQRVWKRITTWVNGPQPPREYIIVPFGASIQTLPLRILDRWVPRLRYRIALLLAYLFLWLACFIYVIHSGNGAIGDDSPVTISCITRLWGPNAFSCGRDGDQCRPFDNQTYNFRCPASCGNTQVLNPYTVGATTINYHTLVVGGPTEKEGTYENIYRGDSFVCSAAVHAGIISNKDGGCLTASLIGTQPNFPSVTQNGITSIGFNSSFPLAMTLKKRSEGGKQSSSAACSDPQWRALGVSVTFTSILSLFTTSSALFYCATFVSTFFQTALASDAPYSATFDGVVSTAMSRLLPAVFVGLIIYFYCVRYTLRRLRAQVEKTVLWLGACWVGVLSNYTLEKIPLQRLTPHDIKQQPGAIVALVFIVLILVTISCLQAWTFRNEGRLARYLGIYALLGTFVLLLLAIPRLNLRIHHYILALLLLPMTKIQTRPSLLYQGLLVGLFINGIARWGFASILQTSAELQGDARFTNALPIITTPTVSGNNITFSIGLEDGYNGLSALVNDVERFRVFGQSNNTISWMKQVGDTTEYFRFAYFKYDSFGAAAQVYTQAGIWNDDGSWTHMPPGPSSN